MLEIFIGLYCLYFAFTIYTSFMQIGFVKDSMKNKALILEQNSYIEAGNYVVDKEKLSISSSFADFVIFIFWIGFGLKYLDSLIQTDSYILKAVLFINAFIIVNWILTLPFDIYKTFKLDKQYGFSTITPALYINGDLVNLNFDLVDKFTQITNGSVATIFVRKDNDFIRVSTSLKKENGNRAIGTKLDSNHPGYKSVLEGKSYLGKALLFGKEYMTKYIPIIEDNEVIAIAFIGSDISSDLNDLMQTIKNRVIGESGYYYILNSNINDKKYGEFISHPTLSKKSGLDISDKNGVYIVK